MANEQPREISNSEFMEGGGGLYPGGSGRIQDIRYVLWDYDGKQPKDSIFAVKLEMHPNDGSNENKPVIIYWSAGKAAEFQPNHSGSKPLALAPSTAPQLRDSTNWHFVFSKFRDNCGMNPSAIDGTNGICALNGSEITLARIDQPERNIQDEAPTPGGQPRQKSKFKPTVLVPTKCKFSWEGAGASVRPVTATTGAATPAPPMVNGSGSLPNQDNLITECLTVILQANVTAEMPAIPKLMVEQLNARGLSAQDRLKIIPLIKDPAYITRLAEANAWAFNGTTLSA